MQEKSLKKHIIYSLIYLCGLGGRKQYISKPKNQQSPGAKKKLLQLKHQEESVQLLTRYLHLKVRIRELNLF